MILILVLIISLAALIIGVTLPTTTGLTWAQLMPQVMPNIFSTLLGLALALLLAEIIIRRIRFTKGSQQVAPLMMKALAPVYKLDMTLIQKLDYTPNEFKQILGDYIKGSYNPMHIPAAFKDRLITAVAQIEPELVSKGLQAVVDGANIGARFSGVLDAQCLMMLDRTRDNWTKFQDAYTALQRDKTTLAETFLDAHDDTGDLHTLFDFNKVIKRVLDRKLSNGS